MKSNEIKFLGEKQMEDLNGGIICGGACIIGIAAGASFITGVGIGYMIGSDVWGE